MTLSDSDHYAQIIREAECDWEDDESCITSVEGHGIVKYEVKIEDAQLRGQVKVIVISEGSVAAEFLRQTFGSNWKSCGKILKETERNHSDDLELCGLPHAAKPVMASELFMLGDDILVCCCSTSLTQEESLAFSTTVISDFSNALKVEILTVLPMSSYKCGSHQGESEIITRMLTTSKEFTRKNVMLLEQPNILMGVSASVLTLCEIKRINAEVFVLYSSYPDLDSGITRAFKNCLETVPEVKHKMSVGQPAGKKYFSKFDGSNLYM